MKKILLLLVTGCWLLATGYAQTNKIDINAQIKAVPLTDSGAADAYAVSLSMLGGSYFTGMPVVFKAAHTNTGTSTINVNSIGVKTIKKTDGATNLSAGDIQSGAVYFLVYDGTNFQLLAPSSASGASSHNLLSATHSDTTAASAVRGDGIFAIGGTPTWQRLAHPSTSGGYFKWNGTDIVASSGAAAGTGSCTNQVVTAENADAAPTCTTITSAYTSGSFSSSAHNLLSATHGDTTAASVTRGAGLFGIGASPAWTLVSAPSPTNGYFKKNSSGDIVSSTGAAGGTGACSANQFETTDNADAAPTCAQPAFSNLSGTATQAQAGTNATSYTTHGVIVQTNSTTFGSTAAGTSGQVLTSNGSSADPTYQTFAAGGSACTNCAPNPIIGSKYTVRGYSNGSTFTNWGGDINTTTSSSTTNGLPGANDPVPWADVATSTSSGSTSGLNGQAMYKTAKNVDFGWLNAYPTNTTSQRRMLCLTNQTFATQMASDAPAGLWACFRYSTNASDAHWIAITSDGSAQTSTDTGISADTSWHYFEIKASATGAQIDFYIDGTNVATISTHLPTSTTFLLYVSGVTTLSTTAEHFRPAGYYGIFDIL